MSAIRDYRAVRREINSFGELTRKKRDELAQHMHTTFLQMWAEHLASMTPQIAFREYEKHKNAIIQAAGDLQKERKPCEEDLRKIMDAQIVKDLKSTVVTDLSTATTVDETVVVEKDFLVKLQEFEKMLSKEAYLSLKTEVNALVTAKQSAMETDFLGRISTQVEEWKKELQIAPKAVSYLQFKSELGEFEELSKELYDRFVHELQEVLVEAWTKNLEHLSGEELVSMYGATQRKLALLIDLSQERRDYMQAQVQDAFDIRVKKLVETELTQKLNAARNEEELENSKNEVLGTAQQLKSVLSGASYEHLKLHIQQSCNGKSDQLVFTTKVNELKGRLREEPTVQVLADTLNTLTAIERFATEHKTIASELRKIFIDGLKKNISGENKAEAFAEVLDEVATATNLHEQERALVTLEVQKTAETALLGSWSGVLHQQLAQATNLKDLVVLRNKLIQDLEKVKPVISSDAYRHYESMLQQSYERRKRALKTVAFDDLVLGITSWGKGAKLVTVEELASQYQDFKDTITKASTLLVGERDYLEKELEKAYRMQKEHSALARAAAKAEEKRMNDERALLRTKQLLNSIFEWNQRIAQDEESEVIDRYIELYEELKRDADVIGRHYSMVKKQLFDTKNDWLSDRIEQAFSMTSTQAEAENIGAQWLAQLERIAFSDDYSQFKNTITTALDVRKGYFQQLQARSKKEKSFGTKFKDFFKSLVGK